MLKRAFHPVECDLEFLRERKDLFVRWKRETDAESIRAEINASGLSHGELVTRTCGRENFKDANATVEDMTEFRASRSVLTHTLTAIGAALSPEIGRSEEIANLEKTVLMSFELANLVYVPGVETEYRNSEPKERHWIIESAKNVAKMLLTNSYDQPLWNSIGGGPMAVAVSVLQTRVSNADAGEEGIVIGPGPRSHATYALRRLTELRSRACKIPPVKLTCLRLPPSSDDVIVPATNPMPDTSDGVGSTAISRPDENPDLLFDRRSSSNSRESNLPENSRSASDEDEQTGMPMHSSS